jgi:hypothetical protein
MSVEFVLARATTFQIGACIPREQFHNDSAVRRKAVAKASRRLLARVVVFNIAPECLVNCWSLDDYG